MPPLEGGPSNTAQSVSAIEWHHASKPNPRSNPLRSCRCKWTSIEAPGRSAHFYPVCDRPRLLYTRLPSRPGRPRGGRKRNHVSKPSRRQFADFPRSFMRVICACYRILALCQSRSSWGPKQTRDDMFVGPGKQRISKRSLWWTVKRNGTTNNSLG